MQTFLKVFAGLIILFVGIGLFLNPEFQVKREVSIKASPETIHTYINDLNQWPKWSPWQQLDPSVKTTVGDISSGIGASQSWTDNTGGGKLKFTHSSLKDGIVYDLNFAGDPSVFITKMGYRVEGDHTYVSWSMQGKMEPIIIGNYFAQLMDTLVGDSFMLGLNNLKETVESEQSK